MSIRVNHIEYEYVEHETVSDLLHRLRFRFPLVVVAINGQVVLRESYAYTQVPDSAEVSVIHMMSGG